MLVSCSVCGKCRGTFSHKFGGVGCPGAIPSDPEIMQSEGFKYLEESCQSLLSELLEIIASVDDKGGQALAGKRSGSSIIGITVAAKDPSSKDSGIRLTA